MIAAGKLRHRIIVQRPPGKDERDSRGRKTGDFKTLAKVSAKIEQLNGDEADTARQLVATATAKITIRFPRKWKLNTKMRFDFRGRSFDIGFIHNIGELDEYLECLCSETKA